MNLPTILFSLLGWATIVLFVGGLIYRIYIYFKTPMPLKIPINTPPTLPGVIGSMIIEVTLFRKIFKTNLILWFGAWVFHMALLLVLEGIVPFLTPRGFKQMMESVLRTEDRHLRIAGFVSMLAGVVLLYLVH